MLFFLLFPDIIHVESHVNNKQSLNDKNNMFIEKESNVSVTGNFNNGLDSINNELENIESDVEMITGFFPLRKSTQNHFSSKNFNQ